LLLNDNFASIVDGVEEGRLIFDNLKKSIAYTLSSNIPEITPFLFFVLFQMPLALSTILILCIDLGTDMIPAISYAYERSEADIMEKPPRDMRTERLVNAKLIHFSYFQIGMIQAMAGFFAFFVVLNSYGFEPWMVPFRAEAFNAGVVMCSHNTHHLPIYEIDGQKRTQSCTGGKYYMLDLQVAKEYIMLKDCSIEGDACHNPKEAVLHGQTAFFVSIVLTQWFDLIICKTRMLSLKAQGMRNGFMAFGLFFETALTCFILYVPFANTAIRTRPIHFIHWLPSLPFAVLMFFYDETRKFFMRNLPKGNWLERFTYY